MIRRHSIYLHIPFCPVKCSYCAFNTYVGVDHHIPDYVAALTREIELCGLARPDGLVSHTLYFGGGTPSMLTASQIARLIKACQQHLCLHPEAEITLEVEPNTVIAETLAAYREAGINRISLGVQSADAEQLELYRRGHTFEEAHQTFWMLRTAGFRNISIDLIYGAPKQTLASWRHTLNAVLAWRPEHFSLYSLIVEPKTALNRWLERGMLPHPDDDLAADMYLEAREAMADAGYEQYELSTWAKSTVYQSKHNQQYWDVRPYFGLGAGAHGAADGIRYWNTRRIPHYIRAVREGKAVRFPLSASVAGCEPIDMKTAMGEVMMLGLRRTQLGVAYGDFYERFGVDLREQFAEALSRLVEQGLISLAADRVLLSENAYLIGNRVFQEFV